MLGRQALAIVIVSLLAASSAGQEGGSVETDPSAAESQPAREPTPDEVDLRLKIAAATMNHRLLVYQICEDGSCGSESYLQWFKTEWDAEDANAEPRRLVLANCPLPELSGEILVHRASWSTGTGADPHLRVITSPPARRNERQELDLTPDRPCDYRLERRQPAPG